LHHKGSLSLEHSPLRVHNLRKLPHHKDSRLNLRDLPLNLRDLPLNLRDLPKDSHLNRASLQLV